MPLIMTENESNVECYALSSILLIRRSSLPNAGGLYERLAENNWRNVVDRVIIKNQPPPSY